jgi:dienelactone hydrolase
MNITTRTFDYADGDTKLEGYFAYPETLDAFEAMTATPPPRTVLIAHMWGGRTEFVCEQARRLAALGYSAFALDMYGKGIFGDSNEKNARLMQPFVDDRRLVLRRLDAAISALNELPQASTDNLVAIGYCFGGSCVLDLARSGANLKGVVSIHGLLNPPDGIPNKPVKTKVLALHGYLDPMADLDSLRALEAELTHTGADWQVILYGNTQHAFTNPAANNVQFGTVFNPVSSRRAWQAMLNFFDECFE